MKRSLDTGVEVCDNRVKKYQRHATNKKPNMYKDIYKDNQYFGLSNLIKLKGRAFCLYSSCSFSEDQLNKMLEISAIVHIYQHLVYLSIKYEDWSLKWDIDLVREWKHPNKKGSTINETISQYMFPPLNAVQRSILRRNSQSSSCRKNKLMQNIGSTHSIPSRYHYTISLP